VVAPEGVVHGGAQQRFAGSSPMMLDLGLQATVLDEVCAYAELGTRRTYTGAQGGGSGGGGGAPWPMADGMTPARDTGCGAASEL
jgi:hypothetical protein